MSEVADRLAARGIELPPYPQTSGAYARFRLCGPLGFVSAHGPVGDGGIVFRGRVGDELSIEDGQAAARLTTLNILSTLQHYLGDLDRMAAVAKLIVFVQASPEFHEHHLVADGASTLLVDALGEERGEHARGAVGMSSLPLDMAVNIEAIVQVAGG